MLNLLEFIFQRYSYLFNNSLKLLKPPTTRGRKRARRRRPMQETLEALETIQKENLLPEIIRSEVNSLIYPIFALNRKGLNRLEQIEYKAVIKHNRQRLEVIWKVAGHPKFGGSPGPFEKQVYRAIERIINSLPLPIKNPVRLGSFRNLAKLMGLKLDKKKVYPGHVYEDIKDALTKIVTTSIYSKSAFYDKEKKERLEGVFHLYDQVIFKDKTLPDGTIADTNYLFLSDWYLASINNRYVRPLDYIYLESLDTEFTRRFYELFGSKFYYILQNNIPFIRYKYSTLCQLLPAISQKHYSQAKQKLNPSHRQLIETGFFEKVDWPKEKIAKNPPDWFIFYFPGPRAKEEYQKHQNDYQITDGDLFQLVETNITEFPQLSPDNGQPEILTPNQKEILNQLIKFGITEKVAEERVRELEPGFIQDWLEAIKEIPHLTDKRAYLTKALKEKWTLPESYLKTKNLKQTREAIANCPLCNQDGFIILKDAKGSTSATQCPHNLKKIQQLEKTKNLKRIA